jgi:hypothetical protein
MQPSSESTLVAVINIEPLKHSQKTMEENHSEADV